MLNDQVGEDLQRFLRADAPRYVDGEAPTGELVHHHHQLQAPAIPCAVEHEVP